MRQWLRNALAESVLALGLATWNPLANSVHFEQTIDRWIAITTQFFYESKAKEMLAVVRIDQATLDAMQQDWPLTYSDVATIGGRIACHGAQAVFFDFTAAAKYNLANGKDDIYDLVNASGSGERCPSGDFRPDIPVFFANIPGIESPVQDKLRDSGKTFLVQVEQAEKEDNVYPVGPQEFLDSPQTGKDLTPAFGLLKHFCDDSVRLPRPAQNSKPSWCAMTAAAYLSKSPIFLSWDGNAIKDQVKISDSPECNPESQGMPERPGMFDRIVLGLQLLWHPADKRCPPILTLSGADLYRDHAYIQRYSDPAALLRDRIVFVGVDLPGLHDIVTSPVHNVLPGAYVHAVALDNVVTYGDRYFTVPDPQTRWLISGLFFLGVNMIIARSLGPELASPRRSESYRGALGGIAWITFALTTWIALVAYLIWLRHWPTSFLVSLVMYVTGSKVIYSVIEPKVSVLYTAAKRRVEKPPLGRPNGEEDDTKL